MTGVQTCALPISEFQSKANPLKDAIRNSQKVIAETGLKLKDGTLTEPQERAYNLEIDTHTNKLIENRRSLDFHSNYIASEVNPLLDNIAKFDKTMEDTYAKEDDRLAQLKVKELATQVEDNPISVTDTTPEIAFKIYRALKSGRYSNKQPDDEIPAEVEKIKRGKADTAESNQFTGNPFKDYAAGKRLADKRRAEGKN